MWLKTIQKRLDNLINWLNRSFEEELYLERSYTDDLTPSDLLPSDNPNDCEHNCEVQ
jgi:hypothetical protein